jgi:hypothetical protein
VTSAVQRNLTPSSSEPSVRRGPPAVKYNDWPLSDSLAASGKDRDDWAWSKGTSSELVPSEEGLILNTPLRR